MLPLPRARYRASCETHRDWRNESALARFWIVLRSPKTTDCVLSSDTSDSAVSEMSENHPMPIGYPSERNTVARLKMDDPPRALRVTATVISAVPVKRLIGLIPATNLAFLSPRTGPCYRGGNNGGESKGQRPWQIVAIRNRAGNNTDPQQAARRYPSTAQGA